MRTALFGVIAVGLVVDAAIAYRRARVLPSRDLTGTVLVGGISIISILSATFGFGPLRAVAGVAATAAFVATLTVDVLNRSRRARSSASTAATTDP